MIELTDKPIDSAAVLASVESPLAGAVVLFLGTTREFTGQRQTTALQYDCYPEMALRLLRELAAQAESKWPLVGISIVHRLGRLAIGEASVAIAVSAAHRQAAFEAGQWVIDTLKQVVPIWKQEQWADGGSEWIHPGLPGEQGTAGPTNR